MKALVSILCLLLAMAGARAESIVVASTTSVENSGLLAHILPGFTAQTGIEVRVVAQGTGQALATAAHGDADLVLVHDPDAEAKFIAEGHGINRTEIAWNDFIIIGPAADPAHRQGAACDRLDAQFLQRLAELQRAEQVRRIGDRHRRHARVLREAGDLVGADRAFRQGVGGMDPKVDEVSMGHAATLRGGAESGNPLAVPAAPSQMRSLPLPLDATGG